MTRDELANLLSGYQALVARARKILGGAPYYTTPHDDFCDVDVIDDTVIVSWPEYAGGYYAGDGSIEAAERKFPVNLLLLSDVDLEIWQADTKRQLDEQRKAESAYQLAQHQASIEASERQAYERLKRKYERAAE